MCSMSPDLAARLSAERRRKFVGRAAERDLFRSALAADEPPFNVLYVFGSGGVGKTTLLREFAGICREADVPVSYLDARNLEPSPESFTGAVWSALGLAERDSPFEALESCALVRYTTESLLSHMITMPEVHELFGWLRTLTFIESGPLGLFPHDVAREALLADLRWRNPDWYAELHHRARNYYAARLKQTRGRDQQRVLFDYAYLHRDNAVIRPFLEWQEAGTTAPEAMREEDGAVLEAMVEEYEGPESARLAAHWFERQPEGVVIYRDTERRPAGFLTKVALHETTARDREVDPAVVTAWRHLEGYAPLRPGERATLFRFWMARETYQAVSAMQSLIFGNVVQHYLSTPGLAFTFFPTSDPEFWAPAFAYTDLKRLPEADFEVGGRRYGMYGYDWRVTPPMAWMDLLAERETAAEPLAVSPPAITPLVVLGEADFAKAVRDALRNFHRPEELRTNPLFRSRMVVERAGTDAGIGALRDLLQEAAESLQSSPREAKGYRALHRTYLDPAPSQERAAELLSLPFSTYRRHLKGGITRVVEILADHLGDYDVLTRGQALEAGRHVDHRPEVVQPVVHGDRDAGAVVHPGLEIERGRARGQPPLGVEDRPEGRDRTPKHRHDRITYRLDERAILPGDGLPQHLEVVQDPPEGGRVADLAVEVGGVSEVGEEDGQAAHRDPLPGPEQLAGEEVPEDLQGGGLRGGRRLVAPGRALEHEELLGVGGVLEAQHGRQGHLQLVAGPAATLGRERGFLRPTGGRHQEPASGQPEGTEPVTSRFQRHRHATPVARRQQLLDHDVRRQLRSAHAEAALFDPAHRGAGPEGELHRPVEVRVEAYVARLAVGLLLHLRQRRTALLRAAAEGAQQIPPQVEEPRAGRVQAGLQHSPPRRAPRVGERVGPQPRQGEVVSPLDNLREPRDEVGLAGTLGQHPSQRGQPGASSGDESAILLEGERGLSRHFGLRLHRQFVVLAEGGAEGAAVGDLHHRGYGCHPEQVARAYPGLIYEQGSALRPGLQLDQNARRRDGAGAVAAVYAEAIRAHPLERLLLPLDPHPEPGEPQVLAGVLPSLVVRAVDRREAHVPIEPVRIRHERPQLLGGGVEPPLPAVMKLRVAHIDLLVSLFRTPRCCKAPPSPAPLLLLQCRAGKGSGAKR